MFVGGPQRSGTTALVDYLNEHPGVLLCMERYKWMHPRHIKPELFTFERILDYRINPRGDREETNTPWEYHAQLLAGKDARRLSWVGDKNPAYVRNLDRLSRNNPGARFILTYRPLEEVAESFEARMRDPEDPWRLGGFEAGIEHWNIAMRSARDFVEGRAGTDVLILGYEDFFYRNEACVPLISRFLGLDFDERIAETWRRMSASFRENRRPKDPLTGGQAASVRAHKDSAAEGWVLRRIDAQWRSLSADAEDRGAPRVPTHQGGDAGRSKSLERRIGGLERDLAQKTRALDRLRKENARLETRARKLEEQLQSVRGSRTWRLLDGLKRLGLRVRSLVGRSR